MSGFRRQHLGDGGSVVAGIGGTGLDVVRGGHDGLAETEGGGARAGDGKDVAQRGEVAAGGFGDGGLDLNVAAGEGAFGETSGFEGLLDGEVHNRITVPEPTKRVRLFSRKSGTFSLFSWRSTMTWKVPSAAT